MFDANALQIMRECCRDEAAFERLQLLLAQLPQMHPTVPDQREARYKAILNAIPDRIFRVDRNGTCLDFKPIQEDIDLGIDPDDVIGKNIYELLPQPVAELCLKTIWRTLDTGLLQTCEYQLPSPIAIDQLRDFEARLVVSGQEEVLVIAQNITERKQTEAQLRVSIDRDRLLGQIALRIRGSLNLDQILTTTVAEVRQFLNADRVFIGQIDSNWRDNVVAESVAPDWESILAWIADDVYLQEIRVLFQQGQVHAVDDTQQADVSPLLADYYRRCQIHASLGVPIILGEDFFGVLIANQCAHPRHWTPFEVDLLCKLATQVAIAIQQANLYQQVQTLNANLERQVQERTAQLQQNMQELQELSQRQDEFLHAISHDLRTPVMGMALILKRLQAKSPESVMLSRTILDRMVQSCDRQIQMIDSLLEAHSTEIQGMTLHYETVHLATLVNAIVAELEPLIAESRATLTNVVPAADLPLVNADPVQLQRVFENLLTNALKHNPPGLHIIVQASMQGDRIYCSIQDNGVGMTQAESQSLFERYAQGSRVRRSPGIGLGLYLCRQIITAHGGQIGAISRPGAGATFWFTLP